MPCRRAVIRLEGIPQGMAGCLVYRCVGAGRDGIRFGIDLEFAAREQTLEILVGKGEKVVVELSGPRPEGISESDSGRITGEKGLKEP